MPRKVPLKDGDYTMDHTALVYLMDRDGQVRGAVQPQAHARRGRRRPRSATCERLISAGFGPETIIRRPKVARYAL